MTKFIDNLKTIGIIIAILTPVLIAIAYSVGRFLYFWKGVFE